MNRRDFLQGLGLGAGAVWLPRVGRAGPAAAKARPNVVLVMTDDQGYGDLSCHGNRILKTPNLDRLHAQSVRLRDFHVSPLCTPTRAALMTGRHPVRIGAWGTTWGRSLPRRDEVTMADVFSAGGYATGHFGKWHLGDNYPFRPEDRGFAEVLRHGGGGVGQTPDYWGNNYFDDTYFHNGKPRKCKGYCTDVWFDAAMRFIEDNARKRRPLFCYIPTNAPHGPYLVAEKYSKPYRGNPKVPNANFYGMIANIDENLGRLMGKLKQLGIADDTILIFLTDNGTSGGIRARKGFNAGMRGRKGSYYEGGHRVPCFVRWPGGGLPGGRDVDRLAAHVDLMPTLIELCGLQRPKGVKLDGVSLASLLTGKADPWPDRTLFVQYRQSTQPPVKWQCAVMTQRWRLIGGRELYDIQADPGQKRNLAGQHPEVLAEMKKAYERWWAEVSKRFGETCDIVLGSDKENPSRLTGFDWHTRTPWNQGHIRQGAAINGFWAVEIERDGTYEIELRRWPREAAAPITGRPADGRGKAIAATKARLKIGGIDRTQPIPQGAAAVTFRLRLPAGKTRLQTWLLSADGKSRGAYYVYVKRLPQDSSS